MGLGGAILDQREKSYGLRLAEQQNRRNLGPWITSGRKAVPDHPPTSRLQQKTHFYKIETHFYLVTNTVLGGLFIIQIQSTP